MSLIRTYKFIKITQSLNIVTSVTNAEHYPDNDIWNIISSTVPHSFEKLIEINQSLYNEVYRNEFRENV